ncbi:winged helix-turn-helix domain-containing protein [Burkholderia cepacia]|uniref:winged helix-turn-helix domain-containing protein n=1 Tax=Burkholderia cepacia TaxID=292 RepID=UPI00158E5D84|nr:winged helix-turn-helix domain-containing protein [Burkholderia cepacia]
MEEAIEVGSVENKCLRSGGVALLMGDKIASPDMVVRRSDEDDLLVVIFTQQDCFFSELSGRLASDGIYKIVRCADRLSLIRCIMRQRVVVAIIDASFNEDIDALIDWRMLNRMESVSFLLFNLAPSSEYILSSLGEDDDVVWGFCAQEINLRCVRLADRSTVSEEDRQKITLGRYTLDRNNMQVLIEGVVVQLTDREFRLAWMLFKHAGRAVKREVISELVWGKSHLIAAHSLEQHIYRLRGKLHLTGSYGVQLRAVYSVGYLIERMGE